ncbi:MAG: helix-turn-helix domain-containing protein, partial [Calditrichia bacterium]|nr:helix-turn-helix domain-containing protein [Calditrichia bacterium]
MEIITKLQQVGLSRREAEVYIALLQKKEFTAPELAKITTITRTKIYEILQNLVHKGACNESYRNGQKVYRGIEPLIAIQNIIKQYEEEVEKKTRAVIEQKKQAAIS